MIYLLSFFSLLISVGIYITCLGLKKYIKSSLFSPLAITIVGTIIVLLTLNISYQTYNVLGPYINYILTAGITCLAIPLYQQLPLLKRNFKPIILGILAGSMSALATAFLFALFFSLNQVQTITLLPTSITLGLGVEIVRELGGIIPITVAATLITGIFGNIAVIPLLKLFRIKTPIAKGLAIGTASHIMGTVKAFEMCQKKDDCIEGAASSLALVLAAIITVVVMSIIFMIF